jgi:hypothetical protein
MYKVLLSRHITEYAIYFPGVNNVSASGFVLVFTFPLPAGSLNLYSKIVPTAGK